MLFRLVVLLPLVSVQCFAIAPPGRIVPIRHVTIPCNRTFEDTKAALEAAVPPLNTTYQSYLASGDAQGALAALEALPALNSFITPPRNFGALLTLLNKTAKAVQYEIGNPFTATRMTQYKLGVALYVPVRVLLRQAPDGATAFEYDTPTSTLGQFGDVHVDDIARDLDRNLTQVLVQAAGWQRFG